MFDQALVRHRLQDFFQFRVFGDEVHRRFGRILSDLDRRRDDHIFGGMAFVAHELCQHDPGGAGRFGVFLGDQLKELVYLASTGLGVVGAEYRAGQVEGPVASDVAERRLPNHVDDGQVAKNCQPGLCLFREQGFAREQGAPRDDAGAPVR